MGTLEVAVVGVTMEAVVEACLEAAAACLVVWVTTTALVSRPRKPAVIVRSYVFPSRERFLHSAGSLQFVHLLVRFVKDDDFQLIPSACFEARIIVTVL